MKSSQKRYGAEDIRFASNTSHIDNTVYPWTMTPEELAAYKNKFGGDKMNGLTKEKYVVLKKVGKKKDTEISKIYKITPNKLLLWKTKTFTPEELKALNLPKRVQKEDTAKTIQTEEKPSETENKAVQSDVKEEYEKTIKELQQKLIDDRIVFGEKLQLYIEEKELAYMKAREHEEKYITTFNNLEKTDYELQNANQRIRELESERDQLKLDFDKATSLLNPLIKIVKISL